MMIDSSISARSSSLSSMISSSIFFFFNVAATTEIYTLSLHDALPIFFMVRSYYPSECHADYFDFERIEALKPAIEACGISTLSQSPMLGFHKQMDNRIKLLEEIDAVIHLLMEAKHWGLRKSDRKSG